MRSTGTASRRTVTATCRRGRVSLEVSVPDSLLVLYYELPVLIFPALWDVIQLVPWDF